MKNLFFLFILLPFFSYSQKCTFIENKTDEFTGKRKITTNTFLSGTNELFAIGIQDSTLSLTYANLTGLQLNTDMFKNVDFNNAVMYLKFEDGSIERIKSFKEYYIENKIDITVNNTMLLCGGFPSKKQIEKFSIVPLTIIRIAYNDNMQSAYDIQVKKNKSKEIMENASCILSVY